MILPVGNSDYPYLLLTLKCLVNVDTFCHLIGHNSEQIGVFLKMVINEHKSPALKDIVLWNGGRKIP